MARTAPRARLPIRHARHPRSLFLCAQRDAHDHTPSWRERHRSAGRSDGLAGGNNADDSVHDPPMFDEAAARAAELLELLEGLRAFRKRIIHDTETLAKELKHPAPDVDRALRNHPDIRKIDESIHKLEAELSILGQGTGDL
ncbi:hypothetical protein CDCA_CDCA15G4028 [Cyanidium caldarium]|uniref:Uncharacterized protein n=1 Tax=Cyanidium caldarium TaxID=2771 RepID=A0AAV9J094_CYACA|nr:hypothetical protein CDCA_CDCA15G4028 [Cyanidium caldarium]